MIWEKYGYTNFHEMNLDWILAKILEIEEQIKALPELDEKIKELEEMLKDLNAALAHALGMGLVDNSNYNLYAQVLPDDNNRFNGQMFAQGFCIGDDGGRPVVAQLFVDDPNNDPHTLFTLTHIDDGTKYVAYVDTLEHGNSITFVPQLDHYVVACAGTAGDLGPLVEIGKDGHRIYTHSMPEPCWAVACNQDTIYAMGGSNLYKLDMDFNITEVIPLDIQNSEFVYQGMTADDLYIYLFNGNTIPVGTDEKNINRCSVFSHDGLPVKQVYMNYPLEIEEGDFLDGQLYISSNTTHCALICKADMYTKNRSCSFGEPYDNIDFNQNAIEIHVDESYSDFLVDGSNDHPLSAITWLILWLRNSTDRMNIKIDSDITQTNTLSFRRCPNTIIDINAQNNKIPNLLFEGGTLYLNNAILPGVAGQKSIRFYGKRLVINSITFGVVGESVVPDSFIECTSSYEIKGITINQAADYMFILYGSGYIRSFYVTNATGPYLLYVCGNLVTDGVFPFDLVKADNTWDHVYTAPIECYDQNKTYSITDIKYPGRYTKLANSVINDLPGTVTGTIVYYEMYVYRTNNREFTFHMSDNTVVYYRLTGAF